MEEEPEGALRSTDLPRAVSRVLNRTPTQMPGTIKPFFIEINTFIEKQKYPLVAN